MSSISTFSPVGPAAPGRARAAQLIDFGAAFIVAVVAFPFPFARAALPVPAFVGSIIGTIVVTHGLFVSATLVAWGRTPGMWLLDLAPAGERVRFGAAVRYGLGAVCALLPAAFGAVPLYDPVSGLPARFSGHPLIRTR